jgi:hypothetical protein
MEYVNEQMSPEDLEALMGFAGPMFGEARALEKMTSLKSKTDGYSQDASDKIRDAVSSAEYDVRHQRQVSLERIHIPQDPYQQPMDYQNYPQNVPYQPLQSPVYQQPQIEVGRSGQLEFSFDPKKQDITNNHLKDISNTLKKILKHLEDGSKTTPIVKLT